MPGHARAAISLMLLLLLPQAARAAEAVGASDAAGARAGRWRVELEMGPVWQTRNDVRIPPDGGTEFSLRDFSAGPFFQHRLTLRCDLGERHALRALYAPLELRADGPAPRTIAFAGGLFPAGQPLDTVYKFNSYRLAYLYALDLEGAWRWSIGLSAKIRDARIALAGPDDAREDTDLGFVPLAVVRAEASLSPSTWLALDLEGAAAPQGRAADLSVMLRRRLGAAFDVGLGYRMLEGGADVPSVYTFAWLHYLALSCGATF